MHCHTETVEISVCSFEVLSSRSFRCKEELLFVCCLFEKEYNFCLLQPIPESFWSETLFKVVTACTLRPTSIGFNTGDVDVMEQLPKEVSPLTVNLVILRTRDLIHD